jgi:hypothetical protein
MEAADLDAFVEQALAEGKGWTDEERRAYLAGIDDETHPFFADVDKTDPVMLEAFRQLTYENETEESLAEHFKHEGNERFKRTRLNKMYFKHAALFYTEAIKHAVMAEQTAEMVALRATLLSNRAAANLGVKNYGRCTIALTASPYGAACA